MEYAALQAHINKLMDEIDALKPARGGGRGGRRAVAVATLLDVDDDRAGGGALAARHARASFAIETGVDVGWLERADERLGPSLDVAGGGAAVVAWYVGAKEQMFARQVIADLRFAGFAFGLIFVLMWAHASSALVALLAYLQIVAALGVAFAAYHVRCRGGALPRFASCALSGMRS